jgi:hypothetical protein
MDALDLVLLGLVAVLATALALMLLARLRDLRALRERGPDAVALERSRLRRLAAELHAAHMRIAELEAGRADRELQPAGRFSRA